VFHAIFQASRPVLDVVSRGQDRIYPHFAINDTNWEGANIIGEGVEGPATGQIEPGMMPVAS
jgi:hypothetical protein